MAQQWVYKTLVLTPGSNGLMVMYDDAQQADGRPLHEHLNPLGELGREVQLLIGIGSGNPTLLLRRPLAAVREGTEGL
jgi:hypothetical protein